MAFLIASTLVWVQLIAVVSEMDIGKAIDNLIPGRKHAVSSGGRACPREANLDIFLVVQFLPDEVCRRCLAIGTVFLQSDYSRQRTCQRMRNFILPSGIFSAGVPAGIPVIGAFVTRPMSRS